MSAVAYVWRAHGGRACGRGVVGVRNLYRLRLENPEGYQNQIFSFLDPGEGQDDTRIAVAATWHDRGMKAALEPVLQALTRDYADLRTPAGACLEAFVHNLEAAAAALPDNTAALFDLGVVLCRGRGLYVLYSGAMQPQFSLGGPVQPLESTLRVRVKELPLADSAAPPRLAQRLTLARVFFEDEDRVVLWLQPKQGAAPALPVTPAESLRIVLHKEPVAEEQQEANADTFWPEAPQEQARDRVRMSYVAVALVAIVFVTAMFGMSRWRRMGEAERASGDALLQESVDSSLEPSPPSRVSADVSEREQPEDEDTSAMRLAAQAPSEAPLHLLWSKSHRDWVTSSPRIAQGNVVYGCRDGHLYAVRSDGEPLWDYDSGTGIGATPEVDGTRVYCGNYGGRAFALRALDGEELWARELGAKIVATPVLGKQLVFFQTYAGDLVALEQKTGKVAWKQRLGGQLRARPLIAGDDVLAVSGNGELFKLEQKSGAQSWSFPLGARVISSPVRIQDLVVVGSQDGRVHGISIKKGQQVWRVALGTAIEAGLAAAQERIYVGCNDRTLYALRREDGGTVWRFETRGPIRSTPWLEENQVYVTSYDRHTYVLDAEKGTQVAQLALRAPIYSSPLVHDGRVYVGSYDGTLYCMSAVR